MKELYMLLLDLYDYQDYEDDSNVMINRVVKTLEKYFENQEKSNDSITR